MMKLPTIAAAGLLLVAALSGSAVAQIRLDRPVTGGGSQSPPAQTGGMINALTAEQVMQLVGKTEGVRGAEIIKLNNGQPAVRAEINGIKFLVFLYQCENGACHTMTFFTTFGKQAIDVNWVNSFNRDQRFLRVYIDKEGAVNVEYDVHFYGGVSPNYVSQSAIVFGVFLKSLLEYKPS